MIYNMKFKYDKIKLDEFEYEHNQNQSKKHYTNNIYHITLIKID